MNFVKILVKDVIFWILAIFPFMYMINWSFVLMPIILLLIILLILPYFEPLITVLVVLKNFLYSLFSKKVVDNKQLSIKESLSNLEFSFVRSLLSSVLTLIMIILLIGLSANFVNEFNLERFLSLYSIYFIILIAYMMIKHFDDIRNKK